MEFAPNNIVYTQSKQFVRDWKIAAKRVSEFVKSQLQLQSPDVRCRSDIKEKDAWLYIERPHLMVHLVAVRFSRDSLISVLDIRVWIRKENQDVYEHLNQSVDFQFQGVTLEKTTGLSPRASWASYLRKKNIELMGIQYCYRQGSFIDEASIVEQMGHFLKTFFKYLLNVLEEDELQDTAQSDDQETSFIDESPEFIEGANKRRLQWIKERQGQQAFRQMLLEEYSGTCCISGTSVSEALEAAHIVPHNGEQSNTLANGLLLRADLHTLFDLGLINICQETRQVEVAEQLIHTEYGALAGQAIAQPNNSDARPAIEALRWRTCHIWVDRAGSTEDK